MSIEQIKNQLADYAKDIKLNLSHVLTEEGAPDLELKQIYAIALASAYASKNKILITALLSDAHSLLSEEDIHAAKAAVSVMAMNNIYYRFLHLSHDKSFSSMPAKLRMNVMANPKVKKADFELNSLAVSAIFGCGMCMDAHTQELIKHGVSKLGCQSVIRIASVIHATAISLSIGT